MVDDSEKVPAHLSLIAYLPIRRFQPSESPLELLLSTEGGKFLTPQAVVLVVLSSEWISVFGWAFPIVCQVYQLLAG
jgi:hypothetical protein